MWCSVLHAAPQSRDPHSGPRISSAPPESREARSRARCAASGEPERLNSPKTKKAPLAPFCWLIEWRLLRGRIGLRAGSRLRRLGRLELLARLFSPLLQLFLQLLLGGLEFLRVGRRAVIGLGEFGQWQRQRQRRAVGVDGLDQEILALLHAG